MADFDERSLIERCRQGDDDAAFSELVDRYKDLVYGMVHRLTVDRSQVDDLAQDVFLKVHRGLPYFRGEARLSTWIYRIVANVCAQARSRSPREVPLDRGPDRSPIDPLVVDGAFADIELRDRLEKAIAQLPEQYRGQFVDGFAQLIQIPEASCDPTDSFLVVGTVGPSEARRTFPGTQLPCNHG